MRPEHQILVARLRRKSTLAHAHRDWRWRSAGRRALSCIVAIAVLCRADPGWADKGFQLDRYEPTAPGEPTFLVEHPWYSSTRWFAGGLTLDYGHNPLVVGRDMNGSFQSETAVVAHQFTGHLDLAASFLDRVLVTTSLPVVFVERGEAAGGVSPLSSPSVGDLRLGAMARIWGQPLRDKLSVSFGGYLWVPVGVEGNHAGDGTVRGLLRLVLGGMAHKNLRWTFNYGFLIRPSSTLGNVMTDLGGKVGSEVQFGLSLGYTDDAQRLHLGPELYFSTVVVGGSAFAVDYSSLEGLLSAQYTFADRILVGVGSGFGLLRAPGTPDFRALARIAFVGNRRPDADKDGIQDAVDACPNDPGPSRSDAKTNGCPDRDRDGIIDRDDQCPDVPMGEHPDPKRLGCPAPDRDRDGVIDHADLCPDEPQGEHPDPDRRGCPLADRDSDGVFDKVDQCPDTPMGEHPDPNRRGCPALDSDRDTVFDNEDQCPTVPMGESPDPARKGCPLQDRDKDSVADEVDACPDVPGMPHPEKQKNGCPGLVIVRGDQLVILTPVFFATDKDKILAKSYPVLEAVADVLRARTDIQRLSVEGHTDDRGKIAHNMDLSQRRAASVMRWLVEHGIEEPRLEAHGYGPTRPVDTNITSDGRARNRRVEFHMLEPGQSAPPVPSLGSVLSSAPSVPSPGSTRSREPMEYHRRNHGH